MNRIGVDVKRIDVNRISVISGRVEKFFGAWILKIFGSLVNGKRLYPKSPWGLSIFLN